MCRSLSALLFTSAALICAGCGGKLVDAPETYPASGVVRSASGTPLSGGAIYFRQAETPELEALAEIQADRTFILYTMCQGHRLEGAIAGNHTVIVVPPSGPSGMSPAITIAAPANVTTGENQLPIGNVTVNEFAMVIGDVAIVGVPAEYFTSLGMDIKKRSPFKHTYVAELANDWFGYLPDRDGHRLGDIKPGWGCTVTRKSAPNGWPMKSIRCLRY